MEHKKQSDKRRFGIITLQPRANFGGILQTYAIQKVFERIGHKAILIDSNPEVSLPTKTKYLVYLKRTIRKYFLKHDIVVIIDKHINKEQKIITQHTTLFIDKYINKINKAKDFNNIKKEEFDGYIVGSDQIWRPIYYHTHIKHAFLDFAKDWNVKRIAYAASFGTDKWEYNEEETRICSELAQKFDAISVREASAVDICKKRLGVNAMHVLDPTMLLTANDYRKLFIDAGTPQSPGNLMCYILDQNKETDDIIKLVSRSHELIPFHTNSRVEDDNAPIEERIQPPVESWLRGFHDARYVITDSFHACVFSILFNKPFIVYGNKARGMARFNSLLSIFNLQDRLVATPQEAKIAINKEINWEEVNNILEEWREKSNCYLKAHI